MLALDLAVSPAGTNEEPDPWPLLEVGSVLPSTGAPLWLSSRAYIVGEAGVGKSRLVHDAIRPLDGWRVLSSGGASYATNTPYFPFVELLKSFCHVQDTDTAAEVTEKVTRSLPPGAFAEPVPAALPAKPRTRTDDGDED